MHVGPFEITKGFEENVTYDLKDNAFGEDTQQGQGKNTTLVFFVDEWGCDL